jgi:predicted RND superfamily exporter protein
MAPIPIIQKVAFFSCFWIFSILISVVTLHPIILSVTKPPGAPSEWPRSLQIAGWTVLGVLGAAFAVISLYAAYDLMGASKLAVMLALMGALYVWSERIYTGITHLIIVASMGWRRWAGVALTIALFIGCPYYGWRLKVGDMTPGSALLFPTHPYNIAYAKLNEKFVGANHLVVIADTGKPDGMKNVETLTMMEEFADHMETAEGAGISVTIVDIMKQLSRLFHEGEPKWSFVPDRQKYIAELFYQFTQTAQAGDLDRFLSADMRYGTIVTLFHGYSHDIIMNAIDTGKSWAADHSEGDVKLLFAGGLFGVLAAVNEAVESSYWTTLFLVMFAVWLFLYATYWTVPSTLILMIPVLMSQFAVEAFMYLMHIDLNVNSLPVAAVGAAMGVDYGIYHFSRMVDLADEGATLDEAVDGATATTGKAIIFTATTMIVGAVFWWFSDLKFQAEMGFLLALLMGFNTFGGLVLVPAWIKVIQPRYLTERGPKATVEPGRTAVA